MSHKTEQGFTLLELLVAIAIFAVLSLSAYQVLQGVMLQDEISKKKADRLAEIQRALLILERDFYAATPVLTRSDGNVSSQVFLAQPYLHQSDDWGITFIRNSWINPGWRLPRSDQEKLTYRLKNNQLERLNFDYPDPAPGSEPFKTQILSEVTAFKLRFFVGHGWQTSWQKRNNLPEGVEVTIELVDLGTIKRIFMLLPLPDISVEDEP